MSDSCPSTTDCKVAVITGGNAGIGLALAERLLTADQTVRVCLACRNMTKADAAQKALQLSHPGSHVDTLKIDVSDVQSVYNAADELKERKVVHMISTGEGLLMQQDSTTKDGLRAVFTTNVFGHFVLLKELEDLLSKQSRPATVVWTSSSNAKKAAFSLDDIQHENGYEPYASSKYAVDLLSIAINQELNSKGIYNHVTNPGLVMTNMTNNIMPSWFWSLFIPILILFRIVSPTMTLSPYNGAECLFWFFNKDPSKIDVDKKYHSSATVLGNRFLRQEKLTYEKDVPMQLYKKLVAMEQTYRRKYKRD
ncbi:3-keto-steroid reductase/17-beta-hydroxysteroid dehydrogenase 7-like isoform X2 [Ptychodera flava]|uniref:3-keto-steroid reductase/17-beta-hydroxysteroid dehydrogenase 7-like isoform X2 n=1 Tax=Ptychodera flava TaxID=63121 RepID=UPI003969CBBB